VLDASAAALGADAAVLDANAAVLGANAAVLDANAAVLGANAAVLDANATVLDANAAVPRASLAAQGANAAGRCASAEALGANVATRRANLALLHANRGLFALHRALPHARRSRRMARRLARPLKHLVLDARNALTMSQAQLGPALGWSHRSAVRWESGKAVPSEDALRKLASLLAPIDADLAAEAAAAVGETLESLGLLPMPVVEKAAPRVTDGDLADAVVCAVGDVTDLPPRALRPLLHAAFARARALGLTVEQLEEALRVRVEAKTQTGKAPMRLRVRVAHGEADEREPEPVVERGRRVRTR
jgi:ribosome-binding protein aMBF1 (putative translation factor)